MADRDDRYRGYGSPSGRYYENREYDRDARERGSYGGDRGRGEWRGDGRDNDRGFFERAGEEIRSWFSDDDDRGGRYGGEDDRGRSRSDDRTRGYGWGSMMSGQGGRDQDRDDRPPQTYRGEPTSGGYDYSRSEWRGRSGGYEAGGSRYGATSGYGAGSAGNQFSRGDDRGSLPHDDHYREWRNHQLSEFDRDYEEYRRENRDKFHSEFSNWRGQRQQQRSSLRQAKEHMEVVGSDGQPVGTVDKIAGDKIILTKSGAGAGGHHHSIPCSWIQSVDDKVTINKTAEQARQQWTDEENRRALFESDEQRQNDGPHILDRSFSGTYER
ncbi:DUF2171 domain-containing protein [Sphingomonas sp.]|uniref:DUF2171 domain-containing protein n=1 Tax=Sphingomonas sp. TaxID=28214 RepID=UPI002DEF64DA|nr:DUF2171 domain-containing protein [Sphingomonas sp.]